MKRGRPSLYKIPADLLKKSDAYFALCIKKKEQPEKAGLCLALGMCRETYNDYRRKEDFSDAIKSIDLYIESSWVKRLNGQAATGAIFYLKNAFKEEYKDRNESNVTLHTPKPLLDALHNNVSNTKAIQSQ